ncbi:MAG: malate dehydrogenase [Candidatus Omnitrophica bacterium]|nr:malate dehydrogenase [Candidatus Omnitrophota bacterium]
MNRKITVVGAGFVGATCAQRVVEKDLADVVLIDIAEGLPQGKALDIMESAPVEGFKAKIIGTNDYKETASSDVVVITAGIPRKPGMSRDDLQATNAGIVRGIVEKIAKHSPDAILILVTNPLDVMSYLALKVSGFEPRKVIGMAGVLDSARYRYFVARELSVSPDAAGAMVFGGHGDSMVPLTKYSTVNGKAITQLLPAEKIEAINKRTREGGAEIVGLLKTGSAYYAPSASAVDMLKSILLDEKRVLPCSVYLNGEYGINDVYCGVSAMLSGAGVEKIVELELTDEEKVLLERSARGVKENIKKLGLCA